MNRNFAILAGAAALALALAGCALASPPAAKGKARRSK